MHRESMIPDVPEELQRTEGINSPAVYATVQYAGSMHSKSKSKIASVVAAQYNSNNSFNERRNPIFGPQQPSPHLVVSNNYGVHPSVSLQPLQLVQDTRAKSPHRMQGHSFSPAANSALKGAKENQVTHIPSHSEYCRRLSQNEPILQVSQTSQQQLSSNMLNLMKEQLELATKAYSARFGEELRRSNEYDSGIIQRELIRLERRIKELEQLLAAREMEVSRLREMFDQSVSARVANTSGGDGKSQKAVPPEEMMRNYDYLAARMRDIEVKLRIIIDGLQFRQAEQRKIGRAETKITQLRDEFMKLEVGRFRTIESRIIQYCTTKDATLAALESQTEQMRLGMQKMDSQSASLGGFELKLLTVKKELEATGRNVQAFLTKEFKYDNFELDNLKGELGKFQKRMTGFEEQRKNKLGQIGQLEAQLRSALEAVKQTAVEVQNRSMEVEKLRKTISTRVMPSNEQAPLLDKKYSQQQLNSRQPQFQDYRHSDYDEQESVEQDDSDFFFHQKRHPHHDGMHASFNQQPTRMQTSTSLQLSMQGMQRKPPGNHNSSFENFTQEEHSDQQKIQKRSPKIQRLVQMIQRGRRKMPLDCQIDQTGYLKYRDTGTYIFDKDGNLFELSRMQIQEAVQRGVIKL